MIPVLPKAIRINKEDTARFLWHRWTKRTFSAFGVTYSGDFIAKTEYRPKDATKRGWRYAFSIGPETNPLKWKYSRVGIYRPEKFYMDSLWIGIEIPGFRWEFAITKPKDPLGKMDRAEA